MGQKAVTYRFTLAVIAPATHRKFMSRLIRNLVILLVVLGGGLYFLSTLASEKPQTRVEKPVANETLAQ